MISIRNINLAFGDHAVFQNFSVEIPSDGVSVVRGPSGAGKTSLFRMLLGLQKPDCGTISGLEGKKVAVVFQEDRLLPWASALKTSRSCPIMRRQKRR